MSNLSIKIQDGSCDLKVIKRARDTEGDFEGYDNDYQWLLQLKRTSHDGNTSVKMGLTKAHMQTFANFMMQDFTCSGGSNLRGVFGYAVAPVAPSRPMTLDERIQQLERVDRELRDLRQAVTSHVEAGISRLDDLDERVSELED